MTAEPTLTQKLTDIASKMRGPSHMELGDILADDVLAAAAEIERLQKWVNDLQSGMYVNCVYCGWRAGEQEAGVPADVLKAHITQCGLHPMKRLMDELAVRKYQQLKSSIETMHLKAMRYIVPKEDVDAPINVNPPELVEELTSLPTQTLCDRLRGIYKIPIDDGAGPLNGSTTFERKFYTGAICHAAAQVIENLQAGTHHEQN